MKSLYKKCSNFRKPLMQPFCMQSISTGNVFQGDSKIISGTKFEPILNTTVPEYVFADSEKFCDKPAFTCSVTKRSYTFNQVYTLSHGFASALKQNGLKPGDCVGIMMPNLPEYPIAELGIMLAGGVVSPISSNFTPDEVTRQCTIAETKIIVTMPVFLKLILRVKSQVPSIKSIINVGEKESGTNCFFEMIKVDYKGVEFIKGSNMDTQQEIIILPFSSGTTGPPKAVAVTHSNIVTNAEQYLSPGVRIQPKGVEQDRLLGILPFYHCFGLATLIISAYKTGAHVLTMPKFDPNLFVACLQAHKPTTLHLVAPILQFMVASPNIGKNELASIQTMLSGASSCGRRLIKAIVEKGDNNLFFQEGYGMTETTTVTHIMRKNRKSKIGSIGELVPGTSCKVVDPDTGEILSQDKPGELWLKGPQVSMGYYKNDAATKDTYQDGWLKTGDIGQYDQDKCFFIVDRLKELIKVKGLQVSPSELEDVLRSSSNILDVAVIGVKHDKFGEAPKAFIVRKNEKFSENDVHDFLERKIAPHKKLAGGIQFVDEIPKAPSGKILRRILIQKYVTNK